MSESNFEILLRENEADLARIRQTYFPLIKDRTITGYNLYTEEFDYSDAPYFLNYLHSDLKKGDKHLEELIEILKADNLDPKSRMTIKERVIDRSQIASRNAVYIVEPEWENPQNMNYFDFTGNPIPLAQGLQTELLIGESVQYDLLLRIEDLKELRRAIDLFKKYTSKLKLDKKGNIIKVRKRISVSNADAITNSWLVPLLFCSSSDNKKPKSSPDLLNIFDVRINEPIGNKTGVVSSLVKKRIKALLSTLDSMEIEYDIQNRYALRIFVEEYLDR